MTPYGNPFDWSAQVDEHDQLTPEERRQHQVMRAHETVSLSVRTASGDEIATQPIPRHAPEPGGPQRGANAEIHDQPPLVPSDRPSILGLVIADFRERERVGIERYGTPLQAYNGRDALVDLYQELQDACAYIRQKIEERTDDTLAERARIHRLALVEAAKGPSGPCCSETRRRTLLDFAALIALPPKKGD